MSRVTSFFLVVLDIFIRIFIVKIWNVVIGGRFPVLEFKIWEGLLLQFAIQYTVYQSILGEELKLIGYALSGYGQANNNNSQRG